ncbi:MAG TPA: HAD family hydrolase, partial [Candidatus Acidoferrum sp.]|nr:HAD family hydrolase [Candidatus Acidoferrum sp.]
MVLGAPAMLFDLDGTLVDSVYQHVAAWHEALQGAGLDLSVWKIHRKIGMSGGLFVRGLVRELGQAVDPELIRALQRRHAEAYAERFEEVVPLPGARELLGALTELGVPWAIATSGGRDVADRTLGLLDLPPDAAIVTRDEVAHAKPDPDLFVRAAEKLDVPIASSVVIGDSVWDLLAARRAGALGVGLLSGGYGGEEL